MLWLQTLRRELAPFTRPTKGIVVDDARRLMSTLDFSEVANVQRMMRKEQRTDQDLQRLRDLNKIVDRNMKLRTENSKNLLSVGRLTKDELLMLVADLEKLKQKVSRGESGVVRPYQGNLTVAQLEMRNKLLVRIGMRDAQQGGARRVWNISDSSLLINQFGTMPSLTMACMVKQGGHDLEDVIAGLNALGIIYTSKYPNMRDLGLLEQDYPALSCINAEESAVNISGYNLSLSAAVKAGATMLDGGNMLECIEVKPTNIADILKGVLTAKVKMSMFVDLTPGKRNPYENVLYKVCLSGEGWPYIASRSQVQGRAWDNTVINLNDGGVPVVRAYTPPAVNNNNNGYDELKKLVKGLMQEIDPSEETWIDIEGKASDPVELAIFQPAGGLVVHIFREPTDKKGFQASAKHCHGIHGDSLKGAQHGLLTAVIRSLPTGITLACQGAADIVELVKTQGRGDLKVLDVTMTKETARKYEDDIWDRYKGHCNKHTLQVTPKKKDKDGSEKDSKKPITPHCALMDVIMFHSASVGSPYNKPLKELIPYDICFRQGPSIIL